MNRKIIFSILVVVILAGLGIGLREMINRPPEEQQKAAALPASYVGTSTTATGMATSTCPAGKVIVDATTNHVNINHDGNCATRASIWPRADCYGNTSCFAEDYGCGSSVTVYILCGQ